MKLVWKERIVRKASKQRAITGSVFTFSTDVKTFVVNFEGKNSVKERRLNGKNLDNVLKNVVIGKISAITSGGCESGHQELRVETAGFLPFQKRWNRPEQVSPSLS